MLYMLYVFNSDTKAVWDVWSITHTLHVNIEKVQMFTWIHDYCSRFSFVFEAIAQVPKYLSLLPNTNIGNEICILFTIVTCSHGNKIFEFA